MNRDQILRQRINLLTWFFIIGLVISGATAMPLRWEVDLMAKWMGIADQTSAQTTNAVSHWLLYVRDALHDCDAKYPFLFYGTDWLAFGHYMIAVVFIGALRHPVRNRWLFDFGIIACISVIPFAFICGTMRGIPLWWRLIDCSFGVFGIIPVWLCRKWVIQLEQRASGSPAN